MTCNVSTETKVTALILLWKPPWCMHKHKDQKMFPSSWPCTSACSEVVFMVIMEMSCLAGQWKPGFNNTLITSLFSFFSHQFIAFRWNLNFLIYLYYWTVLQAATILVDMASTLWGKILASKFWLRDHSFFTAAGWVGGWVGWRIFAPDDLMVLRWDREGISHHWQSVKGDYMEKFLACKFSKKVAKLASQNIPYTYFMFTSYLTGK